MTSQPIGNGLMYVGDCLDVMKTFPDKHVSMTFGSPPYEDRRTYGVGFKLIGQQWVDWMTPRVVEMCRVTDGLVFINAAGPVRNFKYSPTMEWLVTELTRNCGIVCGPAPYAYIRSSIPGSGGKHYHRRDWEPVYSFALPDRLPVKWSDNVAFGEPPKYPPGGMMSNRLANGSRKNSRARNGDVESDADYLPPDLANPGNVIRLDAGGGKMGHDLAHENEAPFHHGLPDRFIAWYVPPDGIVLDPFMGSGTTAQAAEEACRRWIGIDVREDQLDLVDRRLRTVTPALFA